jgi:hypothetical protein
MRGGRGSECVAHAADGHGCHGGSRDAPRPKSLWGYAAEWGAMRALGISAGQS